MTERPDDLIHTTCRIERQNLAWCEAQDKRSRSRVIDRCITAARTGIYDQQAKFIASLGGEDEIVAAVEYARIAKAHGIDVKKEVEASKC